MKKFSSMTFRWKKEVDGSGGELEEWDVGLRFSARLQASSFKLNITFIDPNFITNEDPQRSILPRISTLQYKHRFIKTVETSIKCLPSPASRFCP
jgi:hypothetical protein